MDWKENGAKHLGHTSITQPKNIEWRKFVSKKTPESSFMNSSFSIELDS
tara:strand:- start:86 stop:232 length:147 start_codon:yes stop_codon:yes gene_type:complete